MMEKIPRWKLITLVLGAVLTTIFVVEEFRYSISGVVVDAKIISAKREFAGFSQRNDGSPPMFRNRVSYEFEAHDKTYSGSTPHGGWRDRLGESLTVQYLDGLPQHHRIINTRLNSFRFLMLFVIVWFLAWVSLVARSRFWKHRNTRLKNETGSVE